MRDTFVAQSRTNLLYLHGIYPQLLIFASSSSLRETWNPNGSGKKSCGFDDWKEDVKLIVSHTNEIIFITSTNMKQPIQRIQFLSVLLSFLLRVQIF